MTGHKTYFDDIGSALPGPTTYLLFGQTPGFWSPDGDHLLLSGAVRGHLTDSGTQLVLGVDGSVHVVKSAGSLAGWVDNQSLAWLTKGKRAGQTKRAHAEVRITNLTGDVLRTVPLPIPYAGLRTSQWTSLVSPDGQQILVVAERSFEDVVYRLSLVDGTPRVRPVVVRDAAKPCTVGWAGNTPVMTVLDSNSNGYPVALAGQEMTRLAAVEPRLGAVCLAWADSAIAGTANGSLFGTSMSWWAWWWREITLGLFLTAAGAWGLRRWHAHRRSRALSGEAQRAVG